MEKYNAESLRQSLLNQRKEIYDKSREKIKWSINYFYNYDQSFTTILQVSLKISHKEFLMINLITNIDSIDNRLILKQVENN